MKTFSQFKNVIDGFNDVKETVEVEEKISISNVHKLIKKSKILQNYSNSLKLITSRFLFYNPEFYKEMSNTKNRNINTKNALIIVGGDKGLVGDLWDKIISNDVIDIKKYNGIFIFGKKTYERFIEKYQIKRNNVFEFSNGNTTNKNEKSANNLGVGDITELRLRIENMIKDGSFRKIDVVWPNVEGLSKFVSVKETIFPFNISSDNIKSNNLDAVLPIFSPNKNMLFTFLSKNYIISKVEQIFIETKLAESLSRSISMENAKNEVNKLIKTTTHSFFTERRRILTKNQIEVFMAHKIARG